MKAYVITNDKGDVLGHLRAQSTESEDAPQVGRPSALPGQKIHEIELPQNLYRMDDTEKLHLELKKLVAQPKY